MMSDSGMRGINGSSKKLNDTQSSVVEYLSKLGLDEGDYDGVCQGRAHGPLYARSPPAAPGGLRPLEGASPADRGCRAPRAA